MRYTVEKLGVISALLVAVVSSHAIAGPGKNNGCGIFLETKDPGQKRSNLVAERFLGLRDWSKEYDWSVGRRMYHDSFTVEQRKRPARARKLDDYAMDYAEKLMNPEPARRYTPYFFDLKNGEMAWESAKRFFSVPIKTERIFVGGTHGQTPTEIEVISARGKDAFGGYLEDVIPENEMKNVRVVRVEQPYALNLSGHQLRAEDRKKLDRLGAPNDWGFHKAISASDLPEALQMIKNGERVGDNFSVAFYDVRFIFFHFQAKGIVNIFHLVPASHVFYRDLTEAEVLELGTESFPRPSSPDKTWVKTPVETPKS